MKRVMLIFVMIFLFVGVSYAERETCELDISILNQDPLPAVPGDVVKIVFMLDGIDTASCGIINFEIFDEYPFSIMPYNENTHVIQSGTYTKGYSAYKTIPIDFKVDKNALDGNNVLEVGFKSSFEFGSHTEKFDIEIQDVRVDFEVFVSSYSYATKEIKFEILNIGKSDIEAVTVEVPAQDGIKVFGSNIENIGDLSSNEDTSAEFKMDVTGENIELLISYSDSIQERRTLNSNVIFNADLFENTKSTTDNAFWYWGIGILVVVMIIIYYRKKNKQKRR